MNPKPSIYETAMAAGIEEECSHDQCPMRAGHAGDHDVARFMWDAPATWTLKNQQAVGRSLTVGRQIAEDMARNPGETTFRQYDFRYQLAHGKARAAVLAYAEWITTLAAVAPIEPDLDLEAAAECAETRHNTRGDCDGRMIYVEFLTNLGALKSHQGEAGTMCYSHAHQSVQAGEVKVLRVVTATGGL